ncbi:MAG TPA: CehA/McbA family metallohydrolase [Myxococcota bacterium]|nr:CehA/McbA family metallohydrolase [Myxococcota bacterium]
MLIALLACKPTVEDSSVPSEPTPGIALRADGWLRGDLHVHSDYEGGFEDVATNLALAASLAEPAFQEAHPEYRENELDFVSLTDHRMVDQQQDEGYQSDSLVLIGGEEYGSTGHAGLHGVHEFVDHDPDDDGVTLEDALLAIVATHDQGALFSPNHPFLRDIPWPWDTTDQDAVEVWNSGWALMAPPFRTEDLEAWEASHGDAGATFRRAVQHQGGLASDQSLTWYEAQLAIGRHLAVIGGSDRHAVLLPGFPTTWIRSDGETEGALLDGLGDRHSFVSRTPASAQVLVEVETNSGSWQMGDEVPIPADGEEITLLVRVGRASGGELQIRTGGASTEEDIEDAELGQVLVEEEIDSDDFELSTTLTVMPGDWFYPVVTEPLIAPGLDDEEADLIRDLATQVSRTGAEDFVGLATLFAELADQDVLFDASKCDPEAWLPDQLQCMPADDDALASFFVPDRYDRALNVTVVDGEITDRCMGAVGSAIRFVAE